MTAHDYADFPDFFDRGYAAAVRDGSECWLGLDERGAVQMNVTVFVHRFRLGGRAVVAGMLGNMMVATPYRTFFPALTLLRRVVADLLRSGLVDFIYGDPAPMGAQAVFRAAMLPHVADLERFVLPVQDARLLRALAARLYGVVLRARAGRYVARSTCIPAAECEEGSLTEVDGLDGRLRPLHSAALYRRRLPGFPSVHDWWVELRRGARSTPPDGAVLVRGPTEHGSVNILVVRRASGVSLGELMPSLARVARELGGTRLQLETLRDSAFGREFVACGFLPRRDLVPIFARAFTPPGEEALKRAHDWELTTIDMER